jgi:hypothetical protein
MQPEQSPIPTLDYSRAPYEASWRTPLAFALAVPIGVVGGAFIWTAGMGSLFALVMFAPLAAAGLCLLATRKRVVVGLVMCVFVACSLVVQSMRFDSQIQRPFELGRNVGVFSFSLAATGVLSLFVSVPLTRAKRAAS